MARKRVIDPEFWVDDNMSELNFLSRLLYIGLWNFSDDYGVVEYAPKKLKAQIFPYDVIDITEELKDLIRIGRLVLFEAEGKKWLYIKNFLKWQRVDKPSSKRNPEYKFVEESPSVSEESAPKLSEVKRSKVKLISEQDSQHIAEIIQIFKEISPSLNFGNKTQRSACSEMLKKYGYEALIPMCKVVVSVQGKPYAPRASTPHAMWTKIGDFKSYFEAEKSKQNKIADV